jgi:hypothetical protein
MKTVKIDQANADALNALVRLVKWMQDMPVDSDVINEAILSKIYDFEEVLGVDGTPMNVNDEGILIWADDRDEEFTVVAE